MSFQLNKSVDFGLAKAGLLTVGYQLFDSDGTPDGPRVTSGIVEINPGLYCTYVTFPDDFHGVILWDTGGSPIQYASEDVDAPIDISTDLSAIEADIAAIRAKTDGFGAITVTLASVVSETGDLPNIIQGDGYTDATYDWGIIVWTEDTGKWNKYVGMDANFVARSWNKDIFIKAVTISEVNSTTVNISMPLTKDETAAFLAGVWVFKIKAENSTAASPLEGIMTVQRDIKA
jgi:hypothetical protein